MFSPITTNTTVAELVDHWLHQLRVDQRLDGTTINEYERVLRRLVVPGLGTMRLAELTTDRFNALLAELGTQSVNRQRKAKVVTGAMLDTAVARGALEVNPLRGSLSIRRPKTAARSLTVDEADDVRAAVRAWLRKDRPGPKSSADMADIIDLMLATGARIGEVLALRWRDIDMGAGIMQVNATIKTESGKGTYRKALAVTRTIAMPEFATGVLRERRPSVADSEIDAVFPTRNGTWQQVNNVERRWRQIRQDASLDWVTPHAFRRVTTPRT